MFTCVSRSQYLSHVKYEQSEAFNLSVIYNDKTSVYQME